MSLLALSGTNSVSGEYEIDNSIKIEPDNDEGLYFTPSSTTNTDTFTFSCWFKRTEISNQINTLFGSYTDGSNHALFRFKTDDTLELRFVTTGTGKILVSDMLFRDTSGFYHMVLAVDTTDGTTANRVKVYINGEQITLTGDYPNQNQDCIGINTASKAMNVGYLSNVSNVEFAGYIAEAHHIDGSQLSSTDFGQYDEDSGIWKPKAYTGSYGTNGFYLDFEDNTSAGKDTSGNNNNFSDANLNAADHATDTPTNNFCTLNPLSAGGNQGNVITEGATKVVIENSGQQVAVGTIAVTNGKWYWEAKHTSGTYQFAGIISADSRVSGNSGVADSSVAGSDAIALYRVNGQVFYNGTGTAFDTNSYTNGDIIGVALDMDNGTCALYKNGVLMGNAGSNDIVAKSGHASLTGAWTAMYSDGTNGTFNITYEVNFGGYHTYSISSGNTDENGYGNFEYAPPSGYYALCTKNLAEYG